MAVYRTYPSNAGFQFHWMDSWQDILGTTIEKGYYFQFHWMDSPEERARKAEEIETFNFIGWIPDASDAVKSTTRKLRLSISLDGFPPVLACVPVCWGVALSISLDGFYGTRVGLAHELSLSISLDGFYTITLHVHCGNFSHLHCMDSIPLSPLLGSPCIWCRIWYLSFSLLPLIGFPMLWMGVSIVYC